MPQVDPRSAVATPPELAARLAARLPVDVPVLDPACGEGALLEAARARGIAASLLTGWELDPARLAVARARHGSATLVRRDALDGATPWPRGSWVLANPPWASFSGRQRSSASRPEGPGGWPSLHGAFLVRIARHVDEEGTGAALLVPGAVVELERYGATRAAVTRHARPVGLPLELGEDAFEGVVERPVLLELRPRRPGEAASEAPWVPRTIDPLVEALAPFPRLPERTFADPGVHTGNCSRELVLGPDGAGAPLRQGRDLTAWRLGPASARLRVDLERSAGRRFRIPPLERMRAFPVLLRQTADRPIAALHTDPTYFRNSLLAARAVPDLDPRFVVSVLNSGPLAAWHRAAHRDARQRTFPQVKVGHLARAPFPIARREEDPSLHDALCAAYGDGPLVDRLVAEAFGVTPSRTGS